MNIEKEYNFGIDTSGLEGILDGLINAPKNTSRNIDVNVKVKGLDSIKKTKEQMDALYEKTVEFGEEFDEVNKKLSSKIKPSLVDITEQEYADAKKKLKGGDAAIANKKTYHGSNSEAREILGLWGKLNAMSTSSGYKIKNLRQISDFVKDVAMLDTSYSENKSIEKTEEYSKAFKSATENAKKLSKEIKTVFDETTKISDTVVSYEKKLRDMSDALDSGNGRYAFHKGNLSSSIINGNSFKKSDSLGDFWESIMSSFGSSGGGDMYYLKRDLFSLAPAFLDKATDERFYALDYDKISKGALKFDSLDKYIEFQKASLNFQKYIAMLATHLDASEFDTMLNYEDNNVVSSIVGLTEKDIFKDLKNSIPNMKMTFEDFSSFVEEMVAIFKQLGEIELGSLGFKKFVNKTELGNSASTMERLMERLGYTGVDVTSVPQLDDYGEGSVVYNIDKQLPYVKEFSTYIEALQFRLNSLIESAQNGGINSVGRRLGEVSEKAESATESIEELAKELAELGSSEFNVELGLSDIDKADEKVENLVDDFGELAKAGTEVYNGEVVDINDKPLKERLEYLKQLKKESKFMEDAEEKRLNMEDKSWDVGGNNPKSEADSQNKIRKYEELVEHIDNARAALDKFEEDYEEVIITMKNGDEYIVNYSSDLDGLSLALNRIKDIRFNERMVEYPFEDYFDSTDENYERILKERQDSVLKENDSFVEDFKNDVEQVSKANDELREEIDERDMLTRETDESKHSGVGFDINHIPYADVQTEQESLSSLLPTLERIQTAISEKNELFKEEATIVDQSVERETTALLQLSLIISKIIQQLRELNNLDIKINIDISSVRGLVESLDKADYSNLLEILKYSNELKNLAKILSESTKKINETKRAVKETRPEVPDATLIKAYEDAENTLIYDRKRLADEKELNKERKSGAKQTKEIEADIVKTVEKREELEKAISDRIESGKYTGKVVEEILNPLSKNVSQIDSSSMSFEEYKSAVTDAVAALKNFDKESQNNKNYLVAQNISVDKLNDRIQEFVNNNSKMGKANASAFKSIANGLEYGMSKADYETALSNTVKLEAKIKELGLTGKSVFELLGNRIKQMSINFVAMYFSFYDMIRYGRQVVTTIKDIDTSITELRKVSDASDARLDQSFEKSTKTAKELGAAINDVINTTADWSRLGYSVDQSEELARATTLMKNVSENITAEDASSYLISTLQGFELEANNAIEIIDKYNNVANHMPISTAGIGEALQRSAASFRAANTDLSESIALVTTANSVLQNPEMVGKSLPTCIVICR